MLAACKTGFVKRALLVRLSSHLPNYLTISNQQALLSTTPIRQQQDVKISYELSKVLEDIEDKSFHRMKAEIGSIGKEIGKLDGRLDGLRGEVIGYHHKYGVYAVLFGWLIGILSKFFWDVTKAPTQSTTQNPAAN